MNYKHYRRILSDSFDKSEQEKQEQVPDQQELEPLKKPYVSDAQRRWAHTKAGTKALGGEAKVREWDKESKGKDLPKRVAKSKCESCGSDLIPGGLADKKTNKDFPKKQIDMGRKVEMEHTKDPKVAEEIARDHLTEDKAYYSKLKTIEPKHKMEKRCWEGYKPVPGKKPYSKGSCAPIKKKEEKPFHGYNPKKHARTGGLNDKERKRINREEGRDLKRPQPEGGPRKKSFCARMSGVKGPTSKDGKLTRKGAALKRWACSEKEEKFQGLMKSYRDYFKKKLG